MIDSQVALGTTSRKRKIFFLLMSLLALIIFLAWPSTTAQSPLWEVWVVNEAGQPLQGITVTLICHNYSAEQEGHSEQKQTDASGYAVFSPRSLKVTRFRRLITTIESAGAGVHASFGPHAHVWANGNGLTGDAVSNGYVTDWTGSPPRMSSTIIAKPTQ
jgi:hypothetical protein